MANLARADLEALLRSRQLDRTLTSALPTPATGGGADVLPTGIAALDHLLGGGVPRGALSEVTGARSSGRASLVQAILASAIGAGELTALIDPLDMFDPAAATAGVDMRRLLWVRGEPWQTGPATMPAGLAACAPAVVERGVKALTLVLQAGGFGLAVLDLAEVPVAIIRQLPWTTWLRLQRIIEGTPTVCIVTGPVPMARSAGGVTLALQAVRRGVWAGGAAPLLLGLEFDVRIVRARAVAAATCRLRAVAGSDSLLQPRIGSTRIKGPSTLADPAGAEKAHGRCAAIGR